jgi:hypothetical protein
MKDQLDTMLAVTPPVTPGTVTILHGTGSFATGPSDTFGNNAESHVRFVL